MARAMWTGVITFGLVSVPVGLFTATQDHTVHFHQLQRGTTDRVRAGHRSERPRPLEDEPRGTHRRPRPCRRQAEEDREDRRLTSGPAVPDQRIDMMTWASAPLCQPERAPVTLWPLGQAL